MKEGLIALAIVIVFFGMLGLALTGIRYAIESYKCSSTATIMEVPYKYGLFTGCMVQFEGRWMPIRNVGVRQIN